MKLRDFGKIFDLAAARKGGAANLNRMLAETQSVAPRAVAALSDDRVLSIMTKTIFAAGFAYRIVDRKWPGFEAAFRGFDPRACAFLHDERLDALMRDRSIIRSPRKIVSVPKNAQLVLDLAAEHGSAARYLASWPDRDFIDLVHILRKRGANLGGETAMRFLRALGKPAFVASPDMIRALVREGVLDRPSVGKKTLATVQQALNQWAAETGRDLTFLSRVLSMSIDAAPSSRPRKGPIF